MRYSTRTIRFSERCFGNQILGWGARAWGDRELRPSARLKRTTLGRPLYPPSFAYRWPVETMRYSLTSRYTLLGYLNRRVLGSTHDVVGAKERINTYVKPLHSQG